MPSSFDDQPSGRKSLAKFGKKSRRLWFLISLLALIIGIAILAFGDPAQTPGAILPAILLILFAMIGFSMSVPIFTHTADGHTVRSGAN